VGVERSAEPLRETLELIEFWGRYVMDKVLDEPVAWETQNMLTVAWCIATAAAARTETRGVHYRTDFPETDPRWRCHVDLRRGGEGVQVATPPV
jgi:L-aspartate oxidase